MAALANHTGIVPLINTYNSELSFSYLSTLLPTTLIVFIHGFNGDAINTWKSFDLMLVRDNNFKQSDIVFYGYKSLKNNVATHSNDFYRFIDDLIESNNTLIIKEREKRKLGKAKYEKIIIVAHSLGAFITRTALNYGHSNKVAWLAKVSLALFSPAHHGSRILHLLIASSGMLFLTQLLNSIICGTIPVLDDLRKDSTALQGLHIKTEKLLSDNEGGFTIAKLVLHSRNDRVVYTDQFFEDVISKLFNKSHVAICKPNDNYNDPIKLLSTLIN